MRVVGVIVGALQEMQMATGKARIAVIETILPPSARFDHVIEWRETKGRKWIRVRTRGEGSSDRQTRQSGQ